MQIQGDEKLIEEAISRNNQERDSRMKRLVEEFSHQENYPFFSRKIPIYCEICNMEDKEIELESLEQFSKHVFKIHGDKPVDLVIWVQELILKEILLQKTIHASNNGEFSN